MYIRDFTTADLPALLALQAGCSEAAQWQESDYLRVAQEPAVILLVAAVRDRSNAGRSLATEAEEQRCSPAEQGERADAPLSSTPLCAGAATHPLLSADGPVIGFCAFHRILDEAELQNLVVSPHHRRQGVARALLQEAHGRLWRAGVARVYLEVRPSNVAARALYVSLGYRRQATRKDYYDNPIEDAEVMSVELATLAE
jgi:ribosomal-protein-alanine acetyltransferase